MAQNFAAYGRLPSNAVESVPNWIVIREIVIPAKDGKMAAFGESVAMAQDMATAKLLAAAPEMLAALKHFEKLAASWCDAKAHDLHTAACEAIQWEAQQLIAKAEG
jgi:hypothetical protein